MRFICDVNIAIRIAKFLDGRSEGASHVNQLKTKWNTPDKAIRSLADQTQAIVVTKDSDFRDSFLAHGSPKKLLHVCVGNAATADILHLLDQHWSSIALYSQSERFYLKLNSGGIVPIVA